MLSCWTSNKVTRVGRQQPFCVSFYLGLCLCKLLLLARSIGGCVFMVLVYFEILELYTVIVHLNDLLFVHMERQIT